MAVNLIYLSYDTLNLRFYTYKELKDRRENYSSPNQRLGSKTRLDIEKYYIFNSD